MTTGQIIRAIRKQRGLTQKELGELLSVSAQAIGQFETNDNPPKIETLEKIAAALQVSVPALIGQAKQELSYYASLEQKLSHIGYSIGAYEEEACIWINYPDGTLEVSENDLRELNARADEYMRFLLHSLREKRIDDFRKTRGKGGTYGND